MTDIRKEMIETVNDILLLCRSKDSTRTLAKRIVAALSRPIDNAGEAAGWFNEPTDDGIYHQVAKEFEGTAGTVPLYASPSIVAPVGVKPLLFAKQDVDGTVWASELSATGQYVVRFDGCNWLAVKNQLVLARVGTRDAAFDAAQDEHRGRILSALTPAEKAGVGDGDAEIHEWSCDEKRGRCRNPHGCHCAEIEALQRRALSTTKTTQGDGYQDRVSAAHHALFYDDPTDVAERLARFKEEANETCQAFGMSREDAHRLVDYTWDRPAGEPSKEIGAAMLTLTSLCVVAGYDLMQCAEADLEKLQRPETIARIRAKRETRHGRGPLPGFDPTEGRRG